MKKVFLPFIILSFISVTVNAQWTYSFKDAQKLAVATNKLLLLDFTAEWCGPCKAMDSNTWNQPEVQALMKNFISVKIDIDAEREVARKYAVRSIPNIFIVDASGEIMYQSVGYKDKSKMRSILKKHSLSTKFLQKELLAFFKKKTGDNALVIAEKYLNLSISADKGIRGGLFKLSNSYIVSAKKLFKKEGTKNKKKQKMGLLKVYKDLLRGKYNKGLKKLNSKFKEDEIEAENTAFYEFLQFSFYMKLKDSENAKSWYQKLKTKKDAKLWLLKSRKI